MIYYRRFTSSLQATIIIEALGIVGLRVYCFSLTLGFRLDFHSHVVPDILPFFNLRDEHTYIKLQKKRKKNTPSGRDRKVKMVIQPHDSFWGEEFYFLVTWLQLGECFPHRERERGVMDGHLNYMCNGFYIG